MIQSSGNIQGSIQEGKQHPGNCLSFELSN